jgi:fibro-slime domain-containing protein
MRARLFVGLVLLFSVVAPVMSQDTYIYDTSITTRYVKNFKVPVTYFDYHIDGSNADFGFRVTHRWDTSGLTYQNYHGWADTILTVNKLPKRSPALTDPFLSISWNLEKLFKPWVAGVVDTFIWKTAPAFVDSVDSLGFDVYDTLGNIIIIDTIAVPDTLMISDTMFKNVVIPDSVAFRWDSDSATADTADSIWVSGGFVSTAKIDPIGGRGFGNEEGELENSGYSLTLHNKFTYHGGEKLRVGGDDDVYTFINGKLVIECGGFHNVLPDSLSLDSLHLTAGQKYDLDIFYVERRQGGGLFIAGISDFETKGALRIDTLHDTLITERLGVIPHSRKSMLQKGALSGLCVPPSSQNVRLEYFSISGVKLVEREMPVTFTSANRSVSLPRGMYMVRATFFDAQGKRLATGSFRTIIVK